MNEQFYFTNQEYINQYIIFSGLYNICKEKNIFDISKLVNLNNLNISNLVLLLRQITVQNGFGMSLTGNEYRFYLSIELFLDAALEENSKSIFNFD